MRNWECVWIILEIIIIQLNIIELSHLKQLQLILSSRQITCTLSQHSINRSSITPSNRKSAHLHNSSCIINIWCTIKQPGSLRWQSLLHRWQYLRLSPSQLILQVHSQLSSQVWVCLINWLNLSIKLGRDCLSSLTVLWLSTILHQYS